MDKNTGRLPSSQPRDLREVAELHSSSLEVFLLGRVCCSLTDCNHCTESALGDKCSPKLPFIICLSCVSVCMCVYSRSARSHGGAIHDPETEATPH